MKAINFCKNYFNGFQDISSYKKNDLKTNILAAVKILSYSTIVIPLGFAVVYGMASLYGRVSKNENLSSHDKSVNDKAKAILLKNNTPESVPPSEEASNRQLAEEIISARGQEDVDVKTICSGDFYADPTAHLVRKRI